jgi:hypothetical protein
MTLCQRCESTDGPCRRVDCELHFPDWYSGWAQTLGLDIDPDHPDHHYDWRRAFTAGAVPDINGHWPSEFKRPTHPNLYVEDEEDLLNTKTGERWVRASKLAEAEADAKSWKNQFELYCNAWRRSLGYKLFNKSHLIDALVKTTVHLQENFETWEAETKAIREQRAIETMAATLGVDHRSYLNG